MRSRAGPPRLSSSLFCSRFLSAHRKHARSSDLQKPPPSERELDLPGPDPTRPPLQRAFFLSPSFLSLVSGMSVFSPPRSFSLTPFDLRQSTDRLASLPSRSKSWRQRPLSGPLKFRGFPQRAWAPPTTGKNPKQTPPVFVFVHRSSFFVDEGSFFILPRRFLFASYLSPPIGT